MTKQEAAVYNGKNKFNPDGSVRFFPGNTVISFIDHRDAVFALFQEVRAMLRGSAAADCVTFLPEDSAHMTVFEGVCDQWRRPEVWTKALPLDAPLTEVDAFFERQFQQAQLLGDARMRAVGLRVGGGYMMRLQPLERRDADSLKRYRDQLSELFTLRFPDHDAYGFHISLCYITKAPDAAQNDAFERFEREADAYIARKGTVFTVQAPQLTYFRDMFRFEPRRFERP